MALFFFRSEFHFKLSGLNASLSPFPDDAFTKNNFRFPDQLSPWQKGTGEKESLFLGLISVYAACLRGPRCEKRPNAYKSNSSLFRIGMHATNISAIYCTATVILLMLIKSNLFDDYLSQKSYPALYSQNLPQYGQSSSLDQSPQGQCGNWSDTELHSRRRTGPGEGRVNWFQPSGA